MRTQDIRSTFLNYFKKTHHSVVPSDSLIPSNDPTLLFTNAGMVPFKNIFTGQEKRNYTRATSAQKCIRAGGKHNDLDNVGYTARHHTFFEMLGNFSFGDYFKEEAIYYAWTFLTQEIGLSPEKLYITHFAEDVEARDLWKKISGFSDDKILSIATSDNFWSMGPTGPCGPCSEIFYDHGPSVQGGLPGTPNEDGDRYVEIWNLVFMQYDQINENERVPLPKPCIDTGMGLERIAAALQGTYDNYDTDIFQNLIQLSSDLTNTPAKGAQALSHRVISDHLRAASFMICEGILPSNEGRGYVLRRILRRALRYVHLTGYKGLLLPKLVPNLVHLMGHAYPELERAQTLIEKTLQEEEEKFSVTLSRGLSLLEEEITHLGDKKVLSGHVAFKLYDTYGFPLDMTQDSLKAKGISINLNEFDAAMAQQKEKARANWKGSGDQKENPLFVELGSKFGETTFTGYNAHKSEGKVLALMKENHCVNALHAGDEGYLITDQTPFYAESGGQVGDIGTALAPGIHLEVTDTQKTSKGLIFHKVWVKEGILKTNSVLNLIINVDHRQSVKANHSATHLLHASLRKRFGDTVIQKGSLVTGEKLRFDFTLPHPLSPDDIHFLERDINATCRLNLPTQTKVVDLDQALESGAIALFGEKYANKVRVVQIARHVENEPSVELCGGTHVSATGEIGHFKIIHQSSVASGVRRIEAITGQATENYLNDTLALLDHIAKKLKTNRATITQKIDSLLAERNKFEKEKKIKTSHDNKPLKKEVKKIGTISLVVLLSENTDPKNLRISLDTLKKEHPQKTLSLILNYETKTDKISALLGISQDLTHIFKANELIHDIAESLEGKGGGGRPDMAQCGGKNKKNIPNCLKKVEKLIINK
jgi:alanyl-tRNA synthetase